jgi:membrane dipeptidase
MSASVRSRHFQQYRWKADIAKAISRRMSNGYFPGERPPPVEESWMLDRRKFFLSATAAAVAHPTRAAVALSGYDSWIIINTQGSLGAQLGSPLREPDFNKDTNLRYSPILIKNALASGLTALVLTVAAGTSFDETIAAIEGVNRILAANPELLKVNSTHDVLRAKAEGRIGVIYCFQNAAMVEGKLENVDRFADLGVKSIQLTYNDRNMLGGGSLAPPDTPLTEFGRHVIDRLNDRRVIVDLSHSGERTCLDAVRYSKRPISIDHTGCRALADTPRNKTDEELRLVAVKGGFIGIYFMNFLTITRQFMADDVVAHLEHAMKVCGEDHVGIGSDTFITGVEDEAAAHRLYREFVQKRRDQGIAVLGENPELLRHAPDLNSPDQFRVIARKLEARGYRPRIIEKVLGQNFLRFAKEIWGA